MFFSYKNGWGGISCLKNKEFNAYRNGVSGVNSYKANSYVVNTIKAPPQLVFECHQNV
jgi:hypothetical protein